MSLKIDFEIYSDSCPYSHNCKICGKEIFDHSIDKLIECLEKMRLSDE